MHLTGDELALASSGVAAVAVIAGYVGVRSTNRIQLRLAREAAHRDGQTETYLTLLKGVHLRGALLDDSMRRPADKAPRFPPESEFDPASDEETAFAARLLAYASAEVEELWKTFTEKTAEFNGVLTNLRNGTAGMPPAEIESPDVQARLQSLHQGWLKARTDLRAQVRAELSR